MILDFSDYQKIADLLKSHKFAAVVETDTVMGLIALDPQLIYQIKQRSLNKKLIYFVDNINLIPNLPKYIGEILMKYWPGALTVIYHQTSYRIPNHPQLSKLVHLTGPIWSSSANISGEDPCNDYLDANNIFKEHEDKIIFVKGKNLTHQPSTIINLDTMEVIRNGIIDGRQILDEIKSYQQNHSI